MNKYCKALLTMLFTLSIASSYAEPRNYLALDTGYRWDNISNRATLGGPTVSIVESTQTLKRINSYQLGAKGQYNLWCNTFIKGYAHYGWIGGSKYDESGFRGKNRGHTWNTQLALGYFCGWNCCVGIAPVIGYSWDNFNITGRNIRVAVDGTVYRLSNIKARQRFQGPFVGFDILLQPFCCLDITLGYELHYARWHGQRNIKGNEFGNPPFGTTTGFSNKRRMHGVIGNVFKIDTSYRFCNCWNAGFELTYKLFRGDFGKYHRTVTPIIPQFTFAHIDDLEWHSFAAMIHIGKEF